MPWGKKAAKNRRTVVAKGGQLSGRDAARVARAGGLGDDDKVYDPQGNVIANYSNRTRREGNANGV